MYEIGELLYRYEETYDGYNRSYIHLLVFRISRKTRACVYVKSWGAIEKKIQLSAKKKFAYPTKEQALDSLQRRRTKQISILNYQLERAKAGLQAAKDFNIADPNQSKKDFLGLTEHKSYYEIEV